MVFTPINLSGTSMISPCMNCKKREVGCHGTCKDYLSYKSKIKKIRWTKQYINDYDDYEGDDET